MTARFMFENSNHPESKQETRGHRPRPQSVGSKRRMLQVLPETHLTEIFARECGILERPLDTDIGIVPRDAALRLRPVVFSLLVLNFAVVRERGKAVRETGRNIEE